MPDETSELHGLPEPLQPVANGHPNPYFAANRQHFRELRDELARSVVQGRNVVSAEHEWQGIPRHLRLFVLVFCGIDDPESVLARAWRELPLAERTAIGTCLRELRKHTSRLYALTV